MKKYRKKLLGFITTLTLALTMLTSVAFASTTEPLDEVKNALTSAFTPAEIASVIAIILASGVTFVLLWWGARKLVSAIIGAFETGRLKF